MSASLFSVFGTIDLLVRKSLRQHGVSTLVTVISVALASGLTMAVFAIQTQAVDAFVGTSVGFDAVVGARGSGMQLVLNSVFHLETSPGNIPYAIYQDLRKDPAVELAVPYAVGDNYKGFRIVGTSPEMLTKFEYQRGHTFEVEPGGRPFDPRRQEAVIGSVVAQQTGLTVNQAFNPYHGLTYDPCARHDDEYIVVGVLKPTNSPSDRVVWIPLEGMYRMKGHVLRGGGGEFDASTAATIPDEAKEVSAVMLKFRTKQAGLFMRDRINRQGTVATMVFPIQAELASFFSKIDWIARVLEFIAYLVIVVAAASILAAIYATMNERRREFAILRALGARRWVVFSAIVGEAAAISTIGVCVGFVVYGGILAVASWLIREQTGVVLSVLVVHPALWAVPVAMVLVGALSGLLPAWKAYSTDVAANLSPIS